MPNQVTYPLVVSSKRFAALAVALLLGATASLTAQSISAPLTVTTLAGTAGSRQATNATGADARFYGPSGLAFDGSGNLVVADAANNLVRLVSPAGVVTTWLGSPINPPSRPVNTGTQDGTGASASFHMGEFLSSGGPYDEPIYTSIGSYTLGRDNAGNLYLADTLSHSIRKITPAGAVTTFAGQGNAWGSEDGAGGNARFLSPAGTAVDASGNVYVADSGNNTIRKISPAGVVSTFVGTAGTYGPTNGTGAAARFSNPSGIAIDGSGNLYVTDTANHTIRKVSPAGVVTTLAGTANQSGTADGAGAQARFNRPTGIAIDASGNLYVADTNNHAIRRISPSGNVTTIAGLKGTAGSDNGTGTSARFRSPAGVAVDAAGMVYIADTGNHTIRRGISATGSGSLAVTAVPPALLQVRAGTNVTLKVNASGTPAPTYQWRKNGTAIAGATAATYVLNAVTTDHAGLYSVVVTSDLVTFTSAPTQLQVFAGQTAVPVTIVTQPTDRTVAAGQSTTLSVEASSTGTLTYQWNKDGVAIPGATQATYTVTSAQASDAGVYTVTVSDGVSTAATTGGATLAVTGVTTIAPTITTPPASQTVEVGATVTFTAAATGTPAPTYQWQRNGGNLSNSSTVSGVTTATLTLNSVTAADAGNYTVVATNSAGSTVSTAAALTVNTPQQPSGPTAWLVNVSVRSVMVNGQGPLIVGVTTNGAKDILLRGMGPTLANFGVSAHLTDPKIEIYNTSQAKIAENDNWDASLGPVFAQVYAQPFNTNSKDAALVQTINGSNTAWELATGAGMVLVEAYDTQPNTSAVRLINVSARNRVGTGDDILIAGFSINGTGKKRLLLRGVGPTLAVHGVANPLADPKLEVYNSANQKIAENDNWTATLGTTFDQVYAFQLTAASKDAAMIIELDAGSTYTVQVKGADGGTGEALVEVYELP